jgi:hypothetical protein
MAGRILQRVKRVGQAVKHKVTRLKAAGSAANRAVKEEDLAYLNRRILAIEQAKERHPAAARELGLLKARRVKLQTKLGLIEGKKSKQ